MRISVCDVAHYVVHHYSYDGYDAMQTLCYLLQGWHLGYYGRKFFDEDFYARKDGVYCEELDQAMTECRPLDLVMSVKGNGEKLKGYQVELIRNVISGTNRLGHKKIKENVLSSGPYMNARVYYANGMSNKISKNDMREWFRTYWIEDDEYSLEPD